MNIDWLFPCLFSFLVGVILTHFLARGKRKIYENYIKYHKLGSIYARNGKWDDAIENFKTALGYLKNEEIYLCLINAYLQIGNELRACVCIANYEKAHEDGDYRFRSLFNILLLKRKAFTRVAIKKFQEYIKIYYKGSCKDSDLDVDLRALIPLIYSGEINKSKLIIEDEIRRMSISTGKNWLIDILHLLEEISKIPCWQDVEWVI